MLKWLFIGIVGILVYMIATGNMGGSKKATKNYAEVMRGGGR